MLPLRELTTTDGRLVEVIDAGLHNHNAGPDFFNAKVKIGGTLWVGNVEIHDRASDWYQHGHDKDPHYDNVVLHVCETIDSDVTNSKGQYIPQLQLSVPQHVREHYEELLKTDHYPPCYRIIPDLTRLMVHSWMAALQTERLERKTDDIRRRAEQCGGSWEDAYFVTLARNYGFGINSDTFEQWAMNVPLQAVGHHRDDLFQIEAIFFGQAGLLDGEGEDDYYLRLQKEYRYLRQKFTLTPMSASAWKFLRLRPQNFPHIRIAQLAMLYYEQRLNLSRLLNAEHLDEVNALLLTHVSDYWRTHYTFDSQPTKPMEKHLSPASIDLIIINSVAPMLFTYGKYKSDQHLCDRAFSLWEQLKAENNAIIRDWAAAGVPCENAADSQALLQLHRNYCMRRDCLRCNFGYEYLKRTPDFLREREEGDS